MEPSEAINPYLGPETSMAPAKNADANCKFDKKVFTEIVKAC
jgi:hypothetical protein